MKTTEKLPRATFEVTQIEVGTGGPGYRWVTVFHIITPDGRKLYPPMRRAEVIDYCKRSGWSYAALVNG